MERISFLTEFIKAPRSTGAIAPSSKRLAKAMVERIDFENARTIVELGPGTGVFTTEIMKRKKEDTALILIEINEQFARELTQQLKHDSSVTVIHGSAEYINKYLEELEIESADTILSGLPFASLPANVGTRILQNVNTSLDDNGRFITFQYSQVKRAFIGQFFPTISVKRVWCNIPPAYVFTCQKL